MATTMAGSSSLISSRDAGVANDVGALGRSSTVRSGERGRRGISTEAMQRGFGLVSTTMDRTA